MKNERLYSNIRRAGIAALALAVPFAALAHTTGVSFEQVVGAYKADIGYDPAVLVAGSAERFDFSLLKKDSADEARFSDVWVQIIRGNSTIFATGIHRPYEGEPTLLYTFPEKGTYTISARFENDESAVAEVSFSLPVVAAEENGGSGLMPLAGLLVLGVFLGSLGTWLISRKKTAG